MQTRPDVKKLYSEYVKTLETYIMFRIKQEMLRLTPELKAKNRAPINLSIGAPVQAPPEFVVNSIKKSLDEPGIHLYSTPKGETYYLESISARMQNRFEVNIDPKTEVVSLIGSKEGLATMFRTVITPTFDTENQDIILIPDPGYASYKEQIKVAGGRAYPMPLNYENKFMPDPEKVLESIKNDGLNPEKVKAFVINYPSNPLGATATREYLQKVVDFCCKNNILLISDLAYADVYFDENERPASILEFEGAKDIAIEFHSLSKPYSMTGWRIGWACGNADAVSILNKLKATCDTGIFKAVQKAASEILTSDEGDKYIQDACKLYYGKQQIAVNGFRELGWDVDNLLIPKATFYLWLPIPARYNTSAEFVQDLLEKSGIVGVPGNAFGANGEGFFRLSLVCNDDDIHEAIRRMKEDGFYFN